MFSKIMLVSTFDRAMQIAQEGKYTCITHDYQVAKAGGFITKMG
jgi:hypothetical protein